jgi:hypothetical protein
MALVTTVFSNSTLNDGARIYARSWGAGGSLMFAEKARLGLAQVSNTATENVFQDFVKTFWIPVNSDNAFELRWNLPVTQGSLPAFLYLMGYSFNK